MSVTLSLEGMDELRNALRSLPEDLATEAAQIVTDVAQQAKQEIQSGYPVGPTGNLHNHVTVTNNAGSRVSAVSVVKSTAKHAWIFEHGTGNRTTRNGANRGRMPVAAEAQQMIPKVIRLRARMVSLLVDLVRRHGFEVSE